MNYLDKTGLARLWSKITNKIDSVKVPEGGTTGQILVKKSNTDNDTGWADNTGGITGDTLPIGTVVDYDGDTVPENWEEVESEKIEITTGVEYATNEWIDGKQVFMKRVTFTTPTTTDTFETIVTFDSPIKIIMSDFYFHNYSETEVYKFPLSYGGEEICIYLNNRDYTIKAKANYSYATNKNGYGTIKYIKK